MYHRLFIATLVVAESAETFQQRFPNPGHIAMTKDPEHSCEKSMFLTIS
jgi:hypothetical protein